ncbi:MAG: calcium/sodium antiporter [Candidatus Komeilibacteria bacterium]|jgi:cation:H+ antiporter|nr:calcium/sodium antiporter [Candidatus Komeilibacteria bacterium]MBT4447991.1 calcium/sodium antiporter [Candidatus Komeilibacteria bacterium]
MLAIWAVIFVISIWVLVKSADYFTDYSEKLGKILKLPNFIVGVLIVAIGTSLPELATSVAGVSKGEAEFLSGNVLGTVIVNILLGLSLAVVLTKKKARFSWDIVSNDLPFFAGAIFLVAISLMDGRFTTMEAVIFLIGYIIYVIYAYNIQKTAKENEKEKYQKELKSEIKSETEYIETVKKKKDIKKIIPFLLVSLLVVAVSSHYVVEAVIHIADILGLGTSIMAATAVALGTSLPEIFVAVSAARRGNFDLVIGDIIGSNIFDIFVIYGAVGLFTELTITRELFIILISFLIGSFVLMWLTFIDKKLTKAEGWMFVLLYIMFVGKLFNIF